MEIFIVDDEENICENIEFHINNHIGENDKILDVNIKKFTNVEHMLTCIDNGIRPDIIFMDIRLNKYNGIKLAASLQNIDEAITIVFITGYIEYSKDIFNANPFDFLVKPITRQSIDRVMERLLLNEKIKDKPVMAIKEKDITYFINKKDIMYVEAALKYTLIHTLKKVYKTKELFRNIEVETKDILVKCHRSYMVNPARVIKIEKSQLEMVNGDVIPISRANKDEVLEMVKSAINT